MSGRLELTLEISPNDPRILYNLAVAYALNGRKRKALDTLKTAVSNGFADLAKIKADNDLSTLKTSRVLRRSFKVWIRNDNQQVHHSWGRLRSGGAQPGGQPPGMEELLVPSPG